MWTLLNKLGEGGNGVVYLVRSPAGARVAVKLLLSPEDAAHMEAEASLLLRLRHPGIARFHGYLKASREIFGEERGPCFWMEHIEGDDLGAATAQLDADRERTIIGWFHQALEALNYLHREKVCHGDLTPGNLKVDAAGHVRLIDFGLAAIGRAERSGQEGTLLYMAPERFQGIQDAEGDLFSLGTVFYEVLAGRHPREGFRSLSAMFRNVPKPLAEAVPGLEKDFALEARVIDRMIRPQVSERFADTEEILKTLSSRRISSLSESTAPYFSRKFLGGAEEKLAEVEKALDGLGDKNGFLAVRGIAGTGRTRFLNEISFQASLRGIDVQDVSPENLGEGIARVLVASERPGVFLFHDLHNASRAALTGVTALRRSMPSGRYLVFEWNDDTIGAENLRLLEHSPIGAAWEEVRLTDLKPSDTKSFLSGALGEKIADSVWRDIFERTLGNPRLLMEWVSFFQSRGWTGRAHFPADWLEAAESTATGDVHERAAALMTARLGTLSPQETDILHALALVGDAVGLEKILEVVRDAGDADDGWGWIASLERLADQGFVGRITDAHRHTLYKIALPALARALEKSISSEKKTELQTRWVQALADMQDATPAKIVPLLAVGEWTRTVAALSEWIESLRRKERYVSAMSLLESALTRAAFFPDDLVSLSRLLRMKTNILNDLGRYTEALEVAEKVRNLAAADEPLSLKNAKHWLVTGLIHENLGDVAEALSRFERCGKAAADLEETDRRYYMARALTLAGKQLLALGRREEALLRFEDALGLTEGRERAEVCRNLAVSRPRGSDWEETRALLAEAAVLYRAGGYHRGEFAALLTEGNLNLERDLPDEADAAYARADALAEEHRDDLLLARVWNNRGVLARKRGRLADALEWGAKSLEIFRSLGSPADLAESLRQNVTTQSVLGRFPQASALVSELEGLAARDERLRSKLDLARETVSQFRDGPLQNASHVEARPPAWNVEATLAYLQKDEAADPSEAKGLLQTIYKDLPQGLQVTFVDRYDFQNRGGPA